MEPGHLTWLALRGRGGSGGRTSQKGLLHIDLTRVQADVVVQTIKINQG